MGGTDAPLGRHTNVDRFLCHHGWIRRLRAKTPTGERRPSAQSCTSKSKLWDHSGSGRASSYGSCGNPTGAPNASASANGAGSRSAYAVSDPGWKHDASSCAAGHTPWRRFHHQLLKFVYRMRSPLLLAALLSIRIYLFHFFVVSSFGDMHGEIGLPSPELPVL